MKKTLFLIVTLIICCAMLFGCAANQELTTEKFDKQPDKILENSIDYSVIGLSNDIVNKLNESLIKAPESGKLTVGVDMASLSGDITMPTFSLSAASDSKNGRFDLDLDLSTHNPYIIDNIVADARLYVDGDMLVLASENILGGAYAVKFEDIGAFIEKLENSELMKALGMPAGTITDFCEQYGINDEYIVGLKTAWQNASETFSSFGATITAMQQKAKPTYSPAVEETLEINGVAIPVITATATITPDAYDEMMQLYADYIMGFGASYYELISAAVPQALSKQNNMNISQGFDLVMQEIQTALDASIGDTTADMNIKYYLNKQNSQLVRMDLQYQTAVQSQQAAYDLTILISDSFEFSGTITTDGEVIPMGGKITCTQQNGVKTWNYDMSTEANGEKADVSMSLALSDTDDTYTLTVTVSDGFGGTDTTVINGTCDITEKSFGFTIDSAESYGETGKIGISVGYESDVTVEAPEQYKELLNLTADEAYALMGRIGTFARTIPQS